jgi:hypothetical protein
MRLIHTLALSAITIAVTAGVASAQWGAGRPGLQELYRRVVRREAALWRNPHLSGAELRQSLGGLQTGARRDRRRTRLAPLASMK